MGKGGSANWKNIDLSRKIQGLQKPCVLKKPPVWSDTRSSLLFFNLTAIKQETGWHERLSISFILRHITRSRIHSSVSSKYSAIKGYKGNPESPRSFIIQIKGIRHFFVPGELLVANAQLLEANWPAVNNRDNLARRNAVERLLP